MPVPATQAAGAESCSLAAADADGTFRVETKSLNAADASAGTAADIQVWRRHEIRSVMARLGRLSRKVALRVLYGYLKNRHPDDQLVIEYVAALRDAKLVEDD